MRKQSYASLKRKLDEVFSQWTRRRFSGPGGLVHCVSCGTSKHWKEQQCGHFVSRVRLATRWDPENCAPQCSKCNVLLRGNVVGFARWLKNHYGASIFAALDDRSRKPVKYGRGDLRAMIEEYKAKLGRLPNV